MGAAVKTYTEIRGLVKKEMEAITKRDGERPKSAYLVVEIIERLKNIAPWEGYEYTLRLGMNIRKVVEDIIEGKPNYEAQEAREGRVVPFSQDAYKNLNDAIGDKHKLNRSVDQLPALSRKERLKKKLKQTG